MSTKSKSVHGHSFSSLTRGTRVDSKSDPKSEKTPSPSPSTTTPVGNRAVAARSTRQPRLSFSAFAPSSETDHQKKETKPEETTPEVEEENGEEEEEEEKRTWNLRPRKKEEVKNQKSSSVEPKSNRQRGIAAESPGIGGGGVEVGGENHRLWIALSRDEIEEDLFSMSGNRASRRPRKRTKTLQKYIDVISPGLCLVGMNADCFKVSISPAKR